jgi:DNA-binding FadR family transcriptional regulator
MNLDIERPELNFPALTTMVADNICKVIQERKLTIGEKIPNEFELAKLFHVGRGTIREAVKLLISKNILEIRRGTGTFVCEKQGVVDDPFGFHYAKNKTRLIADLISIRLILEPEIAVLAAHYASDDEIAQMLETAQRIDTLAAEKKDFCAEDITFHTLLAQSSRNMVMPNLIPVIHYGIELYNHSLEEYERQKALGCHTEIVNALKNRDPDRAKSAMQTHLGYSKKNVQLILDNLDTKDDVSL